MVRDALAMVRLLNREVRNDPGASGRRSEQRAHGDTTWALSDGLLADDLQDVLPADTDPVDSELDDYDRPIPMEEADTEERTDVPTRLTVLRVG